MPPDASSFFSPARRRVAGVLLLLGVLGGLSWLAQVLPGGGFDLQARKRLFQIQTGKQRSLSEIRRASLMPATSPVVINGIGFGGPLGPWDETGSPGDWIELCNTSSRAVSLKGCALSDSKQEPRKCVLPDVVLRPRGRLLLWADGRNDIASALNVDFRSHRGWTMNKDPFNTRTGLTMWYSNNVPDHAGNPTNWVAGYVRIPAESPAGSGDYDLWLRGQFEGDEPNQIWCRVDEQRPERISVTPEARYIVVPLINTHRKSGHWNLPPGRHIVRFSVLRGALNLDKIALTPAGPGPGTADPVLHVDLKLRDRGESVGLYSPVGVPLDFVAFPALAAGQAYRRRPSGSGHLEIAAAAPLGLEPAAPPALSLESGFLDRDGELRIQPAHTGDTVRYTLDGSIPGTASPACPPVLPIASNCVVRLRSFRPGAAPGPTATRVFWRKERPHLPILWLVMDPISAYDPDLGIMVNLDARGQQAERTAYACLLRPDGTAQAADIGVREQGRGSRFLSPRRSLRITCRPCYGAEHWPGPLFDEAGPAVSSSFTIHADSLVAHPIGLEMMRAAGTRAPRARYVIAWLNQQALGPYFLMEDVESDEYLQQAYGHLDLDVIKHKTFSNPMIRGTMDQFVHDWQSNSNLVRGRLSIAHLGQLVDPALFTHWCQTAQYLGYGDNLQFYLVCNHQAPPPQWDYINWDLDGSFYWFVAGKTNSLMDPGHIEGIRGAFLKQLLKTPDYRAYYVQEFQALLNHVLTAERWLRRLDEYEKLLLPCADLMYEGMVAQCRRNPEKITPQVAREELTSEIADVRRFFQTYHPRVRGFLAEDFQLGELRTVRVAPAEGVGPLEIDGWPEGGAYEGAYWAGTRLRIRAPPGTGARLLRFTVNGHAQTAASLELEVTEPLQIRVEPAPPREGP